MYKQRLWCTAIRYTANNNSISERLGNDTTSAAPSSGYSINACSAFFAVLLVQKHRLAWLHVFCKVAASFRNWNFAEKLQSMIPKSLCFMERQILNFQKLAARPRKQSSLKIKKLTFDITKIRSKLIGDRTGP